MITQPAFRNDYGCYLGSPYEQRIVAWMAERGHTGYASGINDASETYMLTVAEAGPHWQHCEFTRERLDSLNNAIRQDFEDAVERYTDWATD